MHCSLRSIPLVAGDWNQLNVEIKKQTAILRLNGQRIYERSLPLDNDREFGLFFLADENETRVRNPNISQAWPLELPLQSPDLESNSQAIVASLNEARERLFSRIEIGVNCGGVAYPFSHPQKVCVRAR